MTSNPNYIDPQSASAPITTNLRKDELAALLTVEQGATATQRIVATGNSIPLVFTRQTSNGLGGAWVTPPAARFGAEENPNSGDYFAFGLIVSDGQITPIAEADVWKGAVKVNSLSGYGITNAYSFLPTDDYNYTLTSVAPDTPASETTTTEIQDTSRPNFTFPFSGKSFSYFIENCTRVNFDLSIRGGPNGFFSTLYTSAFEISANGSVIDGTTTPIGAWNKIYTFPSPVTLRIRAYNNSWPSTVYPFFSTLDYSVAVTVTVSVPAVPGAVTNLPLFPGSGGSFAGMSTLAVKGRYSVDAESGAYKQQVRCFVRNGVQVDRVLGGSGSSCSFPDLAYYLLRNASKVSTALIDLPTFQSAEIFNSKYQLFFNGVLANSVNLQDYLTRVAPLFMLRFVQINGKFALKPALPLDLASNITIEPIAPRYAFDASNIVVGTLEKLYIDVNQRKPFCALMTWRSQTDSLYGTPKTNEVRYANTAIDGPFEQYDMEEFCTTEEHAVLIGKYIIASRKLTTHTVSFQTTQLVGDLAPADIISVTRSYSSSLAAGETQTIFYQVDTVSEGADGVFSVEATHFPTTATGISQVALDMLTGI